MLTLRLPADIEKRLESLAKRTGRTRSFHAREAILRHINLDGVEEYQARLEEERAKLAEEIRRCLAEEGR